MVTNVLNKSRLINFITGITGVAPGGQAVLNLPCNQRFHRNVLQCTAVNYTGGTALPVVKITGTGTAATATPTIVNGVVTAVAIVAGGSGWTVGDTFTITDATGTGFVGTVDTVTGGPPGALATATVTVGGTPSAISPVTFFSSFRQMVNGVNMRDISVENILKTVIANGYYPSRGELPLYYTDPARNKMQRNDVSSWDLFGQSTFQFQMGISPTVVNPGLVGVQEFDYFRNERRSDDGKGMIPFLEPVAQHQFTWPIVSGRNDITTLPYNFPISRMWLQGSVPGAIYQVEVYQDGNKVAEYTTEQLQQMYQQYGFTFGRPDFVNTNWPTSNAVKSAYGQPIYFDAAYISDPDQRWNKRLKVQANLILRVYSTVPQTLTIVQETMPGSYSS